MGGKMKKTLVIPLIIFFSYSCKPTPEDLAKETCDCYTKAKSHINSDSQIESIDQCGHIAERNQSNLKDIEKDEDMNANQVQQFEARYFKVMDNCK